MSQYMFLEQRTMNGTLDVTDLMFMGANINFTDSKYIADLSNQNSYLYKRLKKAFDSEVLVVLYLQVKFYHQLIA